MRYLAIIFVFGLFTISHCTVRAQVTPSAYKVSLTWSAPPSSPDPVASYNAYRSPSSAYSFVQLNSSVVTQTTYVDPTVQGGQTYDYIVESVDANGVTSAPSNAATVSIPPVPPVVGQATVKSTP